jgi:hypothetical protein
MIQVLIYTRAAASDYDDWKNIYGNKAWGYKHLIPLLKKKLEFQRTLRMASQGLKVSFAQDAWNISKSFLSAAEKFDQNRGLLDDTNVFFSCNGHGGKVESSYHIYNILTFVCSFRGGLGKHTNKLPIACFIFVIYARYIDFKLETGR